MNIEPMHETDLQDVRTLLRACSLPVEGLDAHVTTALVARDDERIVGSAALEMYAPFALLRSVAVAGSHRGRGLGQLLTTEALALARRHQVRGVYLLTETAGTFFPKLGFRPIPRDQVPAPVTQSLEFSTLCPSSAQAMALDLTG